MAFAILSLLLQGGCGTLVPWVMGVAATREIRRGESVDPAYALTLSRDFGPTRIRDMDYERKAANRDQTAFFSGAKTTADAFTLRKTDSDETGKFHLGPAFTLVRTTFDTTMDDSTRSSDSRSVLFGVEAGRVLVDQRLFLTARFVGGLSTVEIPQLSEDENLGSSDLRGMASRLNFELEYLPLRWLSLSAGVAFDTIALPADAHVNDPAPNPGRMENSLQSTTPYLGLRIHWTF